MRDTAIAYRGRSAAAASLVALLLLGLGVAVRPASAAPRTTLSLSPSRALSLLTAGHPLNGVEIGGTVDVRGKTLPRPFECTRCRFDGGLLGQDAVFERTVNLSGSTFVGPVRMPGATFVGPVVFGFVLTRSGDTVRTTFDGIVNFSLATFQDSASFDTAQFGPFAHFEQARFRDEADFPHATFGNAVFDNVRFSKTASFLGTIFTKSVSFDYAAGVAADFTFATFTSTASFFQTATDTLSFHESDFKPGAVLVLTGVAAKSLDLRPEDVRYVNSDARARALQLIESTANADGDLGVANDAHYRLREMRGRTWGWLGHAADVVFYRWIAGYLVVPWRPLVALVVLALVVGLWRASRRPPRVPRERDTLDVGGAPRRTVVPVRLSRWGHEFLDALTLVVPRSGATSGRRGEAFVYRVLFVCMLIGFANSNPTLRQMLDAVL